MSSFKFTRQLRHRKGVENLNFILLKPARLPIWLLKSESRDEKKLKKLNFFPKTPLENASAFLPIARGQEKHKRSMIYELDYIFLKYNE